MRDACVGAILGSGVGGAERVAVARDQKFICLLSKKSKITI